MEEPLLGIAPVFAEMLHCKLPQHAGCGRLPPFREVKLPQRALDPHIDREHTEPSVAEEQRALRDLRSHAGQLAELPASRSIIERRHGIQIKITRGNLRRGLMQELRSIAQPALAQRLFARIRQRTRFGISEQLDSVHRADLLAESLTQLVHGDEGLASALRATEIFFGAEIAQLSDQQLGEIFADVPSKQLPRDRLVDNSLLLTDALVEAGLATHEHEQRAAQVAAHARRFDWTRCAARYEAVYLRLLGDVRKDD